jgi:hypothetical protein
LPNLELPLGINGITLGDAEVGPGVLLYVTEPGLELEPAFAHTHASDNFRISLRGDFVVGRHEYGPGDFRLQQGWKIYPSDSTSCGPDGGWQFLLFADRRGAKMRPAKVTPEYEALLAPEREQAKKVGFTGDAFSDDPADTAGASAISSTLGEMHSSGYVNGSFNDTSGWLSVGGGARAGFALLGEPVKGPALLFVHLAPGSTGPELRLDTEVLRTVMVGDGSAGADELDIGSVRVYTDGCVPPAQGGESGLGELLVIGDRRALVDDFVSGGQWPNALADMIATVRQGLNGAAV